MDSHYYGNSKVFWFIAAAFSYVCYRAKDKKKKVVVGLLIPAALTGFLTGITEPIEFTFLFAVQCYSLLSSIRAAMSATMYQFGVVGNFGSGLIDSLALNWLPMFKNHSWANVCSNYNRINILSNLLLRF